MRENEPSENVHEQQDKNYHSNLQLHRLHSPKAFIHLSIYIQALYMFEGFIWG